MSCQSTKVFFLTLNSLKVYSEVEREASVVRRVEGVVADVGQADVVSQFGVEEVVAHAAAYAQAAVEALKVVVGERLLRLPLLEVLYPAADAVGQVTAEERLQRKVFAYGVDVFHDDGHLDVAL